MSDENSLSNEMILPFSFGLSSVEDCLVRWPRKARISSAYQSAIRDSDVWLEAHQPDAEKKDLSAKLKPSHQIPLLSALTFSCGNQDQLRILSNYIVYLFFADYILDEMQPPRETVELINQIQIEILQQKAPIESLVKKAPAYSKLFYALEDVAKDLKAYSVDAFVKANAALFLGKTAGLSDGATMPFNEFLAFRARTAAAEEVIELVLALRKIVLPERIREQLLHEKIDQNNLLPRQFMNLTSEVVALANDVASFHKEKFSKKPHDGRNVLIYLAQQYINQDQLSQEKAELKACSVVMEMINEKIALFFSCAQKLRESYVESLSEINVLIDVCEDVIIGSMVWSLSTERYYNDKRYEIQLEDFVE